MADVRVRIVTESVENVLGQRTKCICNILNDIAVYNIKRIYFFLFRGKN